MFILWCWYKCVLFSLYLFIPVSSISLISVTIQYAHCILFCSVQSWRDPCSIDPKMILFLKNIVFGPTLDHLLILNIWVLNKPSSAFFSFIFFHWLNTDPHWITCVIIQNVWTQLLKTWPLFFKARARMTPTNTIMDWTLFCLQYNSNFLQICKEIVLSNFGIIMLNDAFLVGFCTST